MSIKKYPIIFWIHSPIGYESFLAFKNQNSDTLVLHGSVRNITTGSELFCLGHPGLYQLQNTFEVDESCRKIKEAITEVIETYDGYILMIPQIGQPYLKILTQSKYCKGFGYYDEGSACYGSDFKNKSLPIYHKYQLKKSAEFLILCELLHVDFMHLQAMYLGGVPFYDYSQEKLLGFFSFFDNAFPGKSPIIMPMPTDRESCIDICKGHSLVLVGAIANTRQDQQVLDEHFSNINFLLKNNPEVNWVVKPHPGDSQNHIWKMLRGRYEMWGDFCDRKNLNPNLEPSFMGFQNYYSKNNSTILYLKNMGKDNFLVVT